MSDQLPTIEATELATVTGAGLGDWLNDNVVKPVKYVARTIYENLPAPLGPTNPNPQLPGIPFRLPR